MQPVTDSISPAERAREVTVRATRISSPVGNLSAMSAGPPPEEARGIIVALPGGGYRAPYFHHPLLPEASLLTLGSRLGFHVLSVDRPGYGLSAKYSTNGYTIEEQADIMIRSITDLRARANGNTVTLIGHSLGGIVALETAAAAGSELLNGVSVAGIPLARSPEETTALRRSGETSSTTAVRLSSVIPSPAQYFGPSGTYDEQVLASLREIAAPVPVAEYMGAVMYHERFWETAPRVATPTQFVALEHEQSSILNADLLDRASRAFAKSAHAEVFMQRTSGHNVSLHRVARSFHLRLIAFAEHCLAGFGGVS